MYVPPYEHGLYINFNPEQKVGKGNAIFLHEPTSCGGTAGCVSISSADVVSLIQWLDLSANPEILICPQSDLSRYYS
jgi:L,D-peptidoglycan transpeptidase YkuD (ErfK/YbiS/YcfS/YnhG family)